MTNFLEIYLILSFICFPIILWLISRADTYDGDDF